MLFALVAALLLFAVPVKAQTTFTEVNEDGVTLTYMVTDADNKYVQVGTGTGTQSGDAYHAYDNSTSVLHIPATVTHEGVTYQVKRIGSTAFRNFSPSAATKVFIADGIETIGYQAFMYCGQNANLYIYIPNTVTTIEGGAFRNSGLTGTMDADGTEHDGVYLPEGITSLAAYGFSAGCKYTKLRVPANYTVLNSSQNVFDCPKLEEIFFPEGLTKVLRGFGGTSTDLPVKKLVLPANVSELDQYAFRGIKTSLKSVVIQRTSSVVTVNDASFTSEAKIMATLYVPKSLEADYRAHAVWSTFENIVGVDDMFIPNLEDQGLINYANATWDSDDNGYFSTAEVAAATTLTYNGASKMKLKSLSGLEDFTALQTISVPNNKLTGANLSALTNVSSFTATGQALTVTATYAGANGLVPVFKGFDAGKVSNLTVNGSSATCTARTGTASDYMVLTSLVSGTNTITYDYDPALPGVPSARINVSITATYDTDGYPINAATFPDPVFRNWISTKYDTDSNGKLNTTELNTIAAVTQIGDANGNAAGQPFSWSSVTAAEAGQAVRDLTGIELFTGLQKLYLNCARITKLDLSNNHKMLQLDIRSNTLLTTLKLGETPESTTAGYFKHYNCPALREIDLSPWKHKVTIWTNNTSTTSAPTATFAWKALTKLVLPQNLANTTLYLTQMPEITEIDLSSVTKASTVTSLYLNNNAKLRTVKLPATSKLATSLKTFSITAGSNSLETVEIDGCKALTTVSVYNNTSLKSIKVNNCTGTANLNVNAYGNAVMESADCSGSTALYNLKVYNNPLMTSVNTTGCPKVNQYYAYGNSATSPGILASVDLTDNTAITDLRVYNQTNMQTLDVSNLPALKILYCNNTGIKNLDLRQNEKLCSLRTYESGMEVLQLGNHPDMVYVTVRDNNISQLDVTGLTNDTTLFVYNTPLTALDVTKCTKLKRLNISDTKISSLDLSNSPDLTVLQAQNTELRSLDLSKNPLITVLRAYGNHLLAADFSNLTALTVNEPNTNVQLGTLNDTISGLFIAPQTDEIEVVNVNGKTGMLVPANVDASKITNMMVNEVATTPAIVTKDGNNYLIINDAQYVATGWNEESVTYQYKTGAVNDAVLMQVVLTPTDGEAVVEEPVDLFVSPLGLADDGKYYSSMYYGTKALIVPEGVTASTYKVVDGVLTVSKTYAAGEVIPAGQAVLVAAETSNTYTFQPVTADGVGDNSSMLYGSDEAYTESEAEYKYFILSRSADPASGTSVGFYWQVENGASINNGAHKAYLKVSRDNVANAKGFSFGGNATGITTITDGNSTDKGTWYTLDGQQLNSRPAQKGVYMHNGKKVIVK